MFQIRRKQPVFNLINRFSCLMGNFFKTYPYEDCTADMVSDNTCFSALTSFNSCNLFGLTVKLLNFPTYAAHFSDSRRVFLSHAVCNSRAYAVRRREDSTARNSLTLCSFGKPFIFTILPFRISSSFHSRESARL